MISEEKLDILENEIEEDTNWMHFDVISAYHALSSIPKLYLPQIVYDFQPSEDKSFILVLGIYPLI